MEFRSVKLSCKIRDQVGNFLQGAFVIYFLREIEKRLGVDQAMLQLVEFRDFGLKTRLFLRQRPGFAVIVPESFLSGELGQLADAPAFCRQVKASSVGIEASRSSGRNAP